MSCAKQFDLRYGEIQVMHCSKVYNYMGVKLTHGRSTTKFCLLLTFESHVGFR